MNSAALGTPAATPWLAQLRAIPRVPLMMGAAAVVAGVAALLMWSSKPDYGVLYSNLSDRDGGAIIASLQQMNIPYKFSEGGGALLIEASKVPEARLRLASQGLPKGGAAGFELLDNQKFGTSQFAEQLNYQRGLEGELARSIGAISAVESVRVHLALPKASLFVREQKKPSASVVLTLLRGRSLDEGQISAIVHLVSSSVPELSAKSVSVIDQAGNLLSAPNAAARGLDVSQLKYTQELEQDYIRRIQAILQPIVGAANVHAQVTADIDFSIVENTTEKYQPNQEPGSAAIRSKQTSESNQPASALPGGVPGSLSNQPPAPPAAPITQPAASAPSAAASVPPAQESGASRKDGTINYELDRSIRHVQQASGGVKRLSVAVVVNYRTSASADGKVLAKALTEAEIEQIRNLVKEAMGFSAERGDSLNVVNSLFASDKVEVAELPLWRQPENIELAKILGKYLLLGMLGLYLWLAVLRPLLKKHLAGPAAVPAAPEIPDATRPAASTPSQAQVEADEQERERLAERHLANVRYAQESAVKDPRMVAMLIKHWMTEK